MYRNIFGSTFFKGGSAAHRENYRVFSIFIHVLQYFWLLDLEKRLNSLFCPVERVFLLSNSCRMFYISSSLIVVACCCS
jgi:hypothetical protein